MPAAGRSASAERIIHAPPERVLAVLADPVQYPVIDGSGSVRHPRTHNPVRLAPGATFAMDMRNRRAVPDYERGRRVRGEPEDRAAPLGAHRVAVRARTGRRGTRVRETFDYANGRGQLLLTLTGTARKNQQSMEKTVERLVELCKSPSAGSA